MKKIRVEDCICHSKIKDHLKIRDSILYEILRSKSDSLKVTDRYYSDNISRLDWSLARDLSSRKWVSILLPSFMDEVTRVMGSMAYNEVELFEMWYQQYLKGDKHGWHIHGQHYTGVYYLEYPKGCSKTEVCSPFNFNKKQLDVEEGDIIIFPAHFIHRGLPNSNFRKTIISFNFDVIYTDIQGEDETHRNCLNLKLIDKKKGFSLLNSVT